MCLLKVQFNLENEKLCHTQSLLSKINGPSEVALVTLFASPTMNRIFFPKIITIRWREINDVIAKSMISNV